MVERASKEVFDVFGWRLVGPKNKNWACVEQENHDRKRSGTHPSDTNFDHLLAGEFGGGGGERCFGWARVVLFRPFRAEKTIFSGFLPPAFAWLRRDKPVFAWLPPSSDFCVTSRRSG